MNTICTLFVLNQSMSATSLACVHNAFSRIKCRSHENNDLSEAVTGESTSEGQGYVKCNCAGHKRCESNRCKCFKKNVKRSSRCHGSLSCKHK